MVLEDESAGCTLYAASRELKIPFSTQLLDTFMESRNWMLNCDFDFWKVEAKYLGHAGLKKELTKQ